MLGIAGMTVIMVAPTGTAVHADTMPAPLWRGATRVMLVCAADLPPATCDALHAAARRHAALPVVPAEDAAAAARDRGTVLLSVAAEGEGAARQLVASARRAVEIDDAEGHVRRAVAWQGDPAGADALIASILPRRPGERLREE